jgi:hypothetical protein
MLLLNDLDLARIPFGIQVISVYLKLQGGSLSKIP